MSQDEGCYELATRSRPTGTTQQSPTGSVADMETDSLIGEDVPYQQSDDEELNRRTLRKLDFILLPFLCG